MSSEADNLWRYESQTLDGAPIAVANLCADLSAAGVYPGPVELGKSEHFHLKIAERTLGKEATLELFGASSVRLELDRVTFQKDSRISLINTKDLALVVCGGTDLDHLHVRNVSWRKDKHGAPQIEFKVTKDDTDLKFRTELHGLRKLITMLESQRDFATAELLYYREMRLRLLHPFAARDGVFNWILNFCYLCSSGFGTSWLLAGLMLLALIFWQAFVFYQLGLDGKDCGDYIDAVGATLAALTMQKQAACYVVGTYGSITSALGFAFCGLQSALLAFAVRRRFRRGSA